MSKAEKTPEMVTEQGPVEQEIVIRAPGPEKQGFLRRMRGALEVLGRRALTLEEADKQIDWLLANAEISAPAGADVREALMDMSQAQFDTLIAGFVGVRVNPQSGG